MRRSESMHRRMKSLVQQAKLLSQTDERRSPHLLGIRCAGVVWSGGVVLCTIDA
jgi:hypothetical protein